MSQTNILVLYGLPCSGKSSVVSGLSNFRSIAVDTIITRIVANPTLDDFARLSDEIVDNIIQQLKSEQPLDTVIEMGCLIQKQAIDRLTQYLVESNSHFVSIKLITDDDELVRRIIARNEQIDRDAGDGIKIDGPDYLSRFKVVFEKNCPEDIIDLDTTLKSSNEVLESLKQLM